MLKTKEELNKELGKINERDKEKLESVISILQDFIKKEQISEDLIFQLNYSGDLLGSISVDYSKRLIKILKQSWMV